METKKDYKDEATRLDLFNELVEKYIELQPPNDTWSDGLSRYLWWRCERIYQTLLIHKQAPKEDFEIKLKGEIDSLTLDISVWQKRYLDSDIHKQIPPGLIGSEDVLDHLKNNPHPLRDYQRKIFHNTITIEFLKQVFDLKETNTKIDNVQPKDVKAWVLYYHFLQEAGNIERFVNQKQEIKAIAEKHNFSDVRFALHYNALRKPNHEDYPFRPVTAIEKAITFLNDFPTAKDLALKRLDKEKTK